MRRLCIIPCGRRKIWDKNPEAGPTSAKNAYIGTLHQACQAYAAQFFDEWVILSAKHGFLLPNDIVPENYDLAFNSKSSEIITIEQLNYQLKEKHIEGYEQIVLLAGKKHRRVVDQLFDQQSLSYPLQPYKGIGYMVQALQTAVRDNKELSLSNTL